MLRRILALLAKELAGLWKDRKTRFVILIPPLVQVMVFAYAATYDVKDVALGIWNEDAGTQGAELVRRFAGSPAFHPAAMPVTPAQAAEVIDAGQVAAVLHVPQNFSADILAGRHAQAQLLIDARRSNTALMIQGYAAAIVAGYASDLAPGRSPPVAVLTRDWFNPNLESQWFILPGLVSVLSMMMAMLVSALSTCHMLSYLHMATVAGVVVTAYRDTAEGTMVTEGKGGRFAEVVLRPVVTISAGSDPAKAEAAHDEAHHACFIANSVNFPVRCKPRIVIASV